MPRQKNSGRITHFPQSTLFHREDANLVRRTEAVLHRAHYPKPTPGVTLEIEHCVHHVLQDARTGDRTLLGDMANHQYGRARGLGEVHQHRGAFAQLRH